MTIYEKLRTKDIISSPSSWRLKNIFLPNAVVISLNGIAVPYYPAICFSGTVYYGYKKKRMFLSIKPAI